MNAEDVSPKSRRSFSWRSVAIGLAGILFGVFCWRGATSSTKSTKREVHEGGSTVVVRDLADRLVSLKEPAQRIVLVRGREIHQLALILGDEVEDKLIAWGPDLYTADRVAYDVYTDRYPRLKTIPKIGSIYADSIDVEYILSLQPDLVVVDLFMVRRGYRSIERMQRAGLPLLFTSNGEDPLRGPQASLRVLGSALGKRAWTEEIVTFMDNEIAKVYQRLPDRGQRPSVYMECGNLGVETFGHTFGYEGNQNLVTWGRYLDELRCHNIALGRVPDRGTLHPEFVLEANPDLICITGSSWQDASDSLSLGLRVSPQSARTELAAFAGRPGWSNLDAIGQNRLYGIFHGYPIHPTSFAAFQQLAKWFYPKEFADLDPVANMKAFYQRFSRVDCSGTWMIEVESDGDSSDH